MEQRNISISHTNGHNGDLRQPLTCLYRSSFANPWIYFKALLHTPHRLYERMFATWSIEAELGEVRRRSGAETKKCLEWYDVFFFGTGAILGGGIFVTAGRIIRDTAGPAIVLSYLLSGFSALLSAICYTEFAVEIPTAGGAYSYISVTLGQFPAFVTGASLLLEYILAGAVLARNFSMYFSASLGFHESNAGRFHIKGFADDFAFWDLPAAGLVIVLMGICCGSAKATSSFNISVVVVYLLFIGTMVAGGFLHGSADNLHQAIAHRSGGDAPYGLHGVVAGAATAYFSYIGHDAVASLAEECRIPEQALPVGHVGSVIFSTLVMSLLATSLAFLQPYDLVSAGAPFVHAFENHEAFHWMAATGAAIGCITAVLMLIMGAARHITVIARSAMVPTCCADINNGTGTPINSTLLIGTLMAIAAYLVSDAPLITIVAVAALFVCCLIAGALTFHRYHASGVNSKYPILAYLVTFLATCGAFSYFFQTEKPLGLATLITGLACFLETLLVSLTLTEVNTPSMWQMPFLPWLASLSIFCNILLLSSIDFHAYRDFGVYLGGVSLVYILYSVHASWDSEETRSQLPKVK